MVAIAIVAICLGAVVAGWTWSATTNSQEVLVARTDIERGSVIDENDLTTVRLSSDPALTRCQRTGSSLWSANARPSTSRADRR